jgi:CRP-like cAMP-binding protein
MQGGSFPGAAVSIPSSRAIKSNRILAALPRDILAGIAPDLHLEPLPLRQVLQAPRVTLKHVVFPIAGVASMISTGNSGRSVEVATIGSEGMIGLPLLLGGQSASAEVFMQVAGEGLIVSAAIFKKHIDRFPTFMRAMLLYTQALMTQIAQCSACTSYHSISERCARWLLQTRDRVGADTFPLTHEFLGLMLGVRRATVTEAAQSLQSAGLIRYHRGVITILDGEGLEETACECYEIINREHTRLLKSVRLG